MFIWRFFKKWFSKFWKFQDFGGGVSANNRTDRVREEIMNSARTENALQKKRPRDSAKPPGSGAWNEGEYLRELYDEFENLKTNIVM